MSILSVSGQANIGQIEPCDRFLTLRRYGAVVHFNDLVESLEDVAEDAAVAVAARVPRCPSRPPLPQHDHPSDLGVRVGPDPEGFDITFEHYYFLVQRDPGGLAQGFVDLDLRSSPARLVGRYCSYLLPKQDGGTSQI